MSNDVKLKFEAWHYDMLRDMGLGVDEIRRLENVFRVEDRDAVPTHTNTCSPPPVRPAMAAAFPDHSEGAYELSRKYVHEFIDELTTLSKREDVIGLTAIVQYANGKQYPHMVGMNDVYRMETLLRGLLEHERIQLWNHWCAPSIPQCKPRYELVGGL